MGARWGQLREGLAKWGQRAARALQAPLRPIRHRLGLVGFLLTAAAGVVAFLASVNYPRDFWSQRSWVFGPVAGWLFLVAVATPIRQQRLNTNARTELELITVCKTTLVGVAKLAGLAVTELTVRMYFVRRPPSLFGLRVLRCAASLTLQVRPPQRSNILWTRGTGIMGLCWEKGEHGRLELLAADTAEIAAAARQLTANEWAQLSRLEQGGLTQQQARAHDYYGTVVAYPIYDNSRKFRGCLVVEGAAGKRPELTTDDVKDYLEVQQQLAWSKAAPRNS